MAEIEQTIKHLAEKYSKALRQKMNDREAEMLADDTSHKILYQALGISEKEGELIDVYQNKGRFLYKYAGAFLEEAAILCFLTKYPDAKKLKISNPLGGRPKTFEIDCLIAQDAFEIKWRDATTDGDHITKEHARIRAIKAMGYKPVRIMFYNPNRLQAKRIQAVIKALYLEIGGEYYASAEAWEYLKQYTGVDLKQILADITISSSTENNL